MPIHLKLAINIGLTMATHVAVKVCWVYTWHHIVGCYMYVGFTRYIYIYIVVATANKFRARLLYMEEHCMKATCAT